MTRGPRSLEARLEHLSTLGQSADDDELRVELRKALAAKSSHLLPARAAKIASARGLAELGPELAAAFTRLIEGPQERDKGCVAKTALARALVELESELTEPCSEVFETGSRCVQWEPVWGGSVDAAAELRGWCAHGLARMRHPGALLTLVELLADPELPARKAAAEALADSGRIEAEAVLRLKALLGDDESEVVGACCASLLHLEPERSVVFVARFLERDALRRHPDRAAAAALALGESRREEAAEPLDAAVDHARDPALQRTLLLALALLRRAPALERLLERLRGGGHLARLALDALALHRHDEALWARVEAVVVELGDPSLAVPEK